MVETLCIGNIYIRLYRVRTLLVRAPARLPDIEIQFFQLILAILCQDTLYYLKIQIWNIFEAYMRIRTVRTRAIVEWALLGWGGKLLVIAFRKYMTCHVQIGAFTSLTV